MFAAASNAVKNVSKTLQIGGPATSQGRWLQDLTEYCSENSVALDFLTTHSYPNDPINGRWPESVGKGAQAEVRFQRSSTSSSSTTDFGCCWC